MKQVIVLFSSVALSALVAVAVVSSAGLSSAQLETDIAELNSQLVEAKTEASKYNGGSILAELQLRVNILQNTKAMLEQKRMSILRGITIVYRDSIERATIKDPNTEIEIARAKSDANNAHQEAALYTGGLIQTMALMREATAKLTEASIEQRLELERSGITMPAPLSAPEKKTPPSGKITSDKDAL